MDNQWRLEVSAAWKEWKNLNGLMELRKPDFQAISYYSAPKKKRIQKDEVDPELLKPSISWEFH